MKVWNYMMVMLTMMIFLFFMGLSPPEVSTKLDKMGINISSTDASLVSYDVGNSNWYSFLFSGSGALLLTVLTGGAVIVGFFTKSFEWKLVLLPFFTTFVIAFVGFGWSIITLASNNDSAGWLVKIIATIFLPLTVMFIVSIVEWFGGAGTG